MKHLSVIIITFKIQYIITKMLHYLEDHMTIMHRREKTIRYHFIDWTNNPIEQYEPLILRGQEIVKNYTILYRATCKKNIRFL